MMRDTACIWNRLRGLAPVLFAAVLAACGRSPCPDGVLSDSLIVEDDEYFLPGGALSGRWSLGRLGAAGIEDCREVFGSIVFNGDVSDFSDFDNLEYLAGSISFLGTGYPRQHVFDRERDVVDGFNALGRVEGAIQSGPTLLGMTSLEYAGHIDAPSVSLFSLVEVDGDLVGVGVGGSLSHLANLERIGRDFVTATGDIGSLQSLERVGRHLAVGFADIVSFTPPVLEEVGGDLTVQQNEEVVAVETPALRLIGGRLTFYENGSRTPDVSLMARRAFSNAEVGNGAIICINGPNDPCPFDENCLEHYDESYCCAPEMDFEECVLMHEWRL